jgi:hypothetical protein
MPSYLPYVYAPYAAVAVLLTIFLAHTLSRNGAVFLDAVFPDAPSMSRAVNRLLVVGFYLVNLGWALITLTARPPFDAASAMETLATKLGTLMLVLAGMHFINLIVFHKIRRSALEK